MNLLTRLTHLKLHWFGDYQLENKGIKILPCKRCDTKFKSYMHYKGYDAVCPDCESMKTDTSLQTLQRVLMLASLISGVSIYFFGLTELWGILLGVSFFLYLLT